MDNQEEIACRICLENDEVENFIHPCDCRGTSGNVHLKCLNKWIIQSGDTHCKTCKVRYRGEGIMPGRHRTRQRANAVVDDNEPQHLIGHSILARSIFRIAITMMLVSVYILLMNKGDIRLEKAAIGIIISLFFLMALKVVYLAANSRMEAHIEDPNDNVNDDDNATDLESGSETED